MSSFLSFDFAHLLVELVALAGSDCGIGVTDDICGGAYGGKKYTHKNSRAMSPPTARMIRRPFIPSLRSSFLYY